MQHEAIRYSLDSKITFSQIQDGSEYDTYKYSKLEERVTKNKIGAMIASEETFHYKCSSIRPRVQILYYIGDITLLNQKILGIVGPRKMSSYGKQVVENLFTAAQDYDIVTISGMAEGVDQLCHQLSHAYNIPTIAVLGGGLGRYMKRPERTIIDQIVDAGGLVISEYKLGEKPNFYTFPQRNRLIAGLADVLFLPEAGEKSGSLITVDCAITMKKPVYATPNSIFTSTSAGILPYIETGVVKSICNLTKFLADHFTSKHICSRPLPTIHLTDEENMLLGNLSRDEPIEAIGLVCGTGWDIQKIIPLLTILEIKGVIHQHSPGKYSLL